MLASLRIRNLALVEDLEWTLGPGFTAVTGETGSGKSIIIGALKLLLGERADKTLIRTGADACTVEAVFQMDDPAAAAMDARLEENGAERCRRRGADSEALVHRGRGEPAICQRVADDAGGAEDAGGFAGGFARAARSPVAALE